MSEVEFFELLQGAEIEEVARVFDEIVSHQELFQLGELGDSFEREEVVEGEIQHFDSSAVRLEKGKGG